MVRILEGGRERLEVIGLEKDILWIRGLEREIGGLAVGGLERDIYIEK